MPQVARTLAYVAANTVKLANPYGGNWKRLRLYILKRDRYLCQCKHCKASGALLPAHEVDHIVRVEDGGTNHPSNLQAINRKCHERKGVEERGFQYAFGCTEAGLPLDPEHPWAKQGLAGALPRTGTAPTGRSRRRNSRLAARSHGGR